MDLVPFDVTNMPLASLVEKASAWAEKLELAEAADKEAKAKALRDVLARQQGAEEQAQRMQVLACVLARQIGQELLAEESVTGVSAGGRGRKTVTTGHSFFPDGAAGRKARQRYKDTARVPGHKFLELCEDNAVSVRKLATLGRRFRPAAKLPEPHPLVQEVSEAKKLQRMLGKLTELAAEQRAKASEAYRWAIVDVQERLSKLHDEMAEVVAQLEDRSDFRDALEAGASARLTPPPATSTAAISSLTGNLP